MGRLFLFLCFLLVATIPAFALLDSRLVLSKPLCAWSPFLHEGPHYYAVGCSERTRLNISTLATFSFSSPCPTDSTLVINSMQEVILWMQRHLQEPLPAADDCHEWQVFYDALNSLPADKVSNLKELAPDPFRQPTFREQELQPIVPRSFPLNSFSFTVEERWFDSPLPSHWTTHAQEDGTLGTTATPLKLPLHFTVERWSRYDGSLEDLAGKLTEEDLLVLLFSFFHDQLHRVRTYGGFHTDWQPDKVLFEGTLEGRKFVLSDLDRRNFHLLPRKGNATPEFLKSVRESMHTMLNFLLVESAHKSQVQAVVRQVKEEESSLCDEITTMEHCFHQLLELVKKALHTHYRSYELNSFWTRLGPSFSFQSLYERLLVLQQTMMETLKMQDEAIALVDKLEERNRKQRKWL